MTGSDGSTACIPAFPFAPVRSSCESSPKASNAPSHRSLCAQVEFILMGGTFMSMPTDYRDFFIRNLHDALSGHTSCNVEEAVRYGEVR